jgi:hypothetical protein
MYTYTYIPIKSENTTVAKATVCPYVGPPHNTSYYEIALHKKSQSTLYDSNDHGE